MAATINGGPAERVKRNIKRMERLMQAIAAERAKVTPRTGRLESLQAELDRRQSENAEIRALLEA